MTNETIHEAIVGIIGVALILLLMGICGGIEQGTIPLF